MSADKVELLHKLSEQQNKIDELENKLAEVTLSLKDLRGFYARADYDDNYFPVNVIMNTLKTLEEKEDD